MDESVIDWKQVRTFLEGYDCAVRIVEQRVLEAQGACLDPAVEQPCHARARSIIATLREKRP